MELHDCVMATYQPARRDDLKPGVAEWIGLYGEWCAAWIIDDGPYAGQYAMAVPDLAIGLRLPFGWVPECDLVLDEPEAKSP